MLTQLLIAAYLIEAGVLLVVAPWTVWWRQNFFAAAFPWIRGLMTQPVVTGVVVTTGVVTILGGVTDLRRALARWFARSEAAPEESSSS